MKRLRRKSDRGIALIVVLLAITLMAAVVAQFSYDAHVDYSLAANESDEVRAYYLARSGINLYKLILTADQKIQGNQAIKDFLVAQGFGGFELWRMIPAIDSAMLRSVASPEIPEEARDELKERFGGIAFDTLGKTDGFLDFQGDLHAEIEDEDGKINVNAIAEDRISSPLDSAVARALFATMLDPKLDRLFEGENAYAERKLGREEVIANLIDWIDANQQGIVSGAAEDYLYANYEERYTAKNAKFETLAELAMVRGIDDDLLAEIGNKLTVYSSGKINVNTAPPEVLAALILAYAQQAIQPDVALEIALKIDAMRQLTPFSKPEDFVAFMRDMAGVTLNDTGPGAVRNRIGVNSKVFTIRATGFAGEARVTITAVADNTGTSLRWLYWRVD